MALIIANTDKQLIISPKRKIFQKYEKEFVIDLKANKPTEVNDDIADVYVKSYPHIYKYADEKKENAEEESVKTEEDNSNGFDPIEFLELNHSRIEEALLGLERKDIVKVAEALGLKTGPLKTERIIDKIIQEVKIRNGQ